jgi:peptidyl-prolyl cis-trans isomerase SurA
MRRIVFCLFFPLLGAVSAGALAQATDDKKPAVAPKPVDRIVAVVNSEVITAREHKARLEIVESQLKRQGTALPPTDVLEKQVLERMITDRVQLQQAKELGVRIDDLQLDQALQRIAASNNMSLANFRAALEKDGIPYARFREDIREEMTISRLREREVDSKIAVSEAEIEAFIESQSKSGPAGEEYEIAHILVRVPEAATPEVLAQRRQRAEEAVRKLKAGEPFAQVAAAYSDAPDALQGGVIGYRKLDRLPSLYAEAVSPLAVGELSDILRSPNGFHVVKLQGRRGGAALPPVQQTRVRHILIRVDEVVSEADAKFKLESLRERLQNGANFAELARLYSQDGSAAKGGELGWIYPGDTVPEFERAMDALKPGEVSRPVQSPFGFHLIEVLERRIQDVSDDRRRLMARAALRERRSGEAYQDWLRQLRDRAYVELRMEEK